MNRVEQKRITVNEFENSSIFSGFGLFYVNGPTGYRVYIDSRRRYLAALQLAGAGEVEAVRMIPLVNECETSYTDSLIKSLVEFFYGGLGGEVRSKRISTEKVRKFNGYRVTYTGRSDGAPEITCSLPGAENWRLVTEVLSA
jgi:hypothetical protein